MESITEWASSFDKNVRNKPNKQLQEELFERITSALKEGTNTCDECVYAFCRFDAKVIEPFYRYHWGKLPDKSQWDQAMLRWADEKKPSVPATIRITLILQQKLWRAETVDDVMPELRWLALHEDDRTAAAIQSMKEKSKAVNLRKLLALDMREWKAGKQQIAKYFGILFADLTDPDSIASSQPQPAAEEPGEKATTDTQASTEGAVSSSEAADRAADPVKQPAPSSTEQEASSSKVTLPVGGVALAEAMLRWAQEQTERYMSLTSRLAEVSSALQRANSQIESQQKQIADLEQLIARFRQKETDLEAQLQAAQGHIALLDEQKAAAQDTIGRVQAMTGNSVRQELDGFKHSLAAELASTFKDFASDVSDLTDAERADIYHALMEEVLDTLRHNGIVIEET